MKLPEDSRVICSGLDMFCLPSSLFARPSNLFVGWNKSFMTAVGLSADELAAVPVTEVMRMETPTAEASECEASPTPVHPEQCILRATVDAPPVAAKLFEREDGDSLLIIDGSTAEQSNEQFIRGLLVGNPEEQGPHRPTFHVDEPPQTNQPPVLP